MAHTHVCSGLAKRCCPVVQPLHSAACGFLLRCCYHVSTGSQNWRYLVQTTPFGWHPMRRHCRKQLRETKTCSSKFLVQSGSCKVQVSSAGGRRDLDGTLCAAVVRRAGHPAQPLHTIQGHHAGPAADVTETRESEERAEGAAAVISAEWRPMRAQHRPVTLRAARRSSNA